MKLRSFRQDVESPLVEVRSDVAHHLWPVEVDAWLPRPHVQTIPLSSPDPVRICMEITWNTPALGRRALPWRPLRERAIQMLTLFRQAPHRPIRWCYLDVATPENCRFLEHVHAFWGQGLACLAPAILPGTDHGTPLAEATQIQRHCLLRVWNGPDRLDPFRVLAALQDGCVPLQCVARSTLGRVMQGLPDALSAFVLPTDPGEKLPALTRDEIQDRVERGLSLVLAGSLERDLRNLGTGWRAA